MLRLPFYWYRYRLDFCYSFVKSGFYTLTIVSGVKSGVDMVKKKIIIKGPKVHDVGYRLFLLDEAEARLIPFFSVKNIKNKEQVVEVIVCSEEDRVERFIEFIKNNFPDDAEVDSVSVEDYEGDIRTIESFSRSFSISQLSKIARTGVAMLNLQSNMNEDIKEFRKETGENFQLLHSDNLRLQEILAKHDTETKELFGVVNREISGIKERLAKLEAEA